MGTKHNVLFITALAVARSPRANSKHNYQLNNVNWRVKSADSYTTKCSRSAFRVDSSCPPMAEKSALVRLRPCRQRCGRKWGREKIAQKQFSYIYRHPTRHHRVITARLQRLMRRIRSPASCHRTVCAWNVKCSPISCSVRCQQRHQAVQRQSRRVFSSTDMTISDHNCHFDCFVGFL